MSLPEKTSLDEYQPVPTTVPPEVPCDVPDEVAEERKTVDSFTRLGWYAARILVLSEFLLLSGAGNMSFMIYGGAAPRNVSCIAEGEIVVEDLCAVSKENRTSLNCSSYLVDYEFHSINVEMEYFCSDTTWVKSSISVQMAGVLVGAMLFGHLSDAYGRRKTLIITFMGTSLAALVSSFANNLIVFTLFRTVLGVFSGGQLVVYVVYKTEHIPRRHRLIITSLISWSPNFILMNGIAYLCHDWRVLQRVLLLVSLPAIAIFPFTFESPRWLIQKGRLEEARKVMQAIQRIDGVGEAKKDSMHRMLDYEHKLLLEKAKKTKMYSVRHLFYTKELSIYTTVLSLGVFTTSLVSYGLMFNFEKLAGSLYLNIIFFGFLRWSIVVFTGTLDYFYPWANRKLFHTAAQGMISANLFIIGLVILLGKKDECSLLIRVCTLLAAASCSQVYITKSTTAIELFPTVVRNTAMSFKTTFSRVGNIIAPVVWYLLPVPWLPFGMLCVMCCVDALSFLVFLPETKGRNLPEALPEKKKALLLS